VGYLTEKELETKLPSTEEILAAYERLFGKNKDSVKQYQRSGVHYVDLPHDMVLLEQNADKESHWAQKTREGHKIAWVMKDGEYLARVVDGKVDLLHHK
jgi:hypothetical protein